MTLKRTYDSQDDIPEALREHYVERDGKWVLDLEGDDGAGRKIKDEDAVLRSLEEERARADRLSRELKELRAKLDKAQQDDARQGTKASADALESAKAEYEAKLRQIAEQRDVFRSRFAESVLDRALTDAIAKQNGYPDRLRPFLRDRVRVEIAEDGTPKLKVIDPATGNERLSRKSDTAQPMTVEELVEEMRSSGEYDWAFRAEVRGGSGSGGTEPAAGGVRKVTWEQVARGEVKPEDLASGKVQVTDA